jgi:PAS domain S-box-containing protein
VKPPFASRPWPLRLQLLLLMAGVALVTMGLLHRMSVLQLDATAQRVAAGQAQRLAEATAAALSTEFVGPAGSPLPAVLRAVGALPGLHSLTLLGADGQARRHFVGGAGGLQEAVALPPGAADGDFVQARAGLGLGGTLVVTLSPEVEREQVAGLHRQGMLGLALLLALMIAAVHAWLHRALAPLPHLLAHARRLGGDEPQASAPAAGSAEFAGLARALDEASIALRSQLQALRHAEARTAAILQATPDAILGLDSQGRVAIANPAVTSVLGLEPEQALGLPLEALLPGIDAEEAASRTEQGLYMRASGSRLARFELNARRHDGTEFPAEVSLSRVDAADGARYACVVRDVTEQRMTFSMLNLYSRALECTTNGVVISDMSLPGQPVFYANPAFCRITGFEAGEVIGRNCALLQRGDTAQPELDVLRRALQVGETATVVLRNYRKDGTLFFNELAVAPVTALDGRVQHYVGIVNDVTERERTRLAIAERSARLNAVFDLSPDGFVVFDRRGRLVYTNRAFDAMTGLGFDAAGEAVTIETFDRRFAALCDGGGSARPLLQALADDDTDDAPETLHLVRPVRRVLARVVRGQRAAQGETILFFRDITQETEVDRMKSEFLTTAAHELRTPMVSVFGFTELLLHRPVSEGRRRDMLETIHRQASLLINMVNELLDLARIEARQGKDMKREPCRVGDLVEQAVAGLMVHGDDRRVRVACRHAALTLHVDPEKIHRALVNVLSNAYKYSPAGGEITLCTLDGEVDGAPALGVRIADHGIGMTPEQTRRVFERFFRADPSGNIPGTGLGMSLVKEIVELHGGRVVLESRLGEGTQVTLWLPLEADATVARLQAPPQHLTHDA